MLILLAGLAPCAASQAAIIDVGPEGVGAGCEASSLEEALQLADNSNAADEIRLRENVQYGGAGGTVLLTNWGPSGYGTLTISGGYSSCTDSNPDGPASGITRTASPAVQVDSTGGFSQVVFENMEIGGSNGRGLVVDGDVYVVLQRSSVIFNDGGGILVDNGGTFYFDADSSVYQNGPTDDGGGILCRGAFSAAEIYGLIGPSNEAVVGGGLAVESGCPVDLYEGARVYANTATFGGGIWAESGGKVYGTFGPVTIDYNDASSSGGGIGAAGPGTQIVLNGASITLNTSQFWAAGVYANDSALVSLGADPTPCGSYLDCPSFVAYNDLLGSGQDGVAAVAAAGGEVRLKQTLISHNDIPDTSTAGSVLYALGGGALISTESVEVSGNLWSRSVFRGGSDGDLHIVLTTAAYNYQDTSPATPSEGIRIEGTGSQVALASSILYPVQSYVLGSGASFDLVDCIMTSTTNGLPGGSFVTVADPLFVNVATGDLRLRRGSPAVDYCDQFYVTPTVPGLDGVERALDDPFDTNGDPGVSGSTSTMDLGAYELGVIFGDGFESGDMSRWDLVGP